MHTVTVPVRTYGVDCRYDGPIAHSLMGLIADLQDALAAVPEEFRGAATVDCMPDYEFGESYGALRISYDRPETPAEAAARIADEQARLTEQLKLARSRVEYFEEQIAGMSNGRQL